MSEQWAVNNTVIKNINDLIEYDSNPRVHSPKQIDQVANSIKEFGWTMPVLIDDKNEIIAGHGRVLAGKKLGIKEVPCILASGWSEEKKKAYCIADNKLTENSTWSKDFLKLNFEFLIDNEFDLGLTGFSTDEIAKIVPDFMIEEGLTDEDEVPEIVDNPITKEGNIWILGEHRLMCGDSTKVDDIDKLLNGENIDLVYTDPPYGINEKGDRSKRGGNSKIVGEMKGLRLKDFKDDSIKYAVDAYNICEDVYKIPKQVWWGANYYCHHLPQSNNWFVWDKRVEDKHKNTNSDCELAWIKSKWNSVRICRHLWNGICKGSETGQKRIHPTQKPIALAEWSFDYFKELETVLDLFGGSGSTLIACEKKQKKCYMMEYDIYYVDVIIKRWQNFTGKDAVLESTGELFNKLK